MDQIMVNLQHQVEEGSEVKQVYGLKESLNNYLARLLHPLWNNTIVTICDFVQMLAPEEHDYIKNKL